MNLSTYSPLDPCGLLAFAAPAASTSLPPKSMAFVNRDGLVRGCHALSATHNLDRFVGQQLFDIWPGESSQMTIKLLQAAFFTGTVQSKQITIFHDDETMTAEVIVIPIDKNEAMVVIR